LSTHNVTLHTWTCHALKVPAYAIMQLTVAITPGPRSANAITTMPLLHSTAENLHTNSSSHSQQAT